MNTKKTISQRIILYIHSTLYPLYKRISLYSNRKVRFVDNLNDNKSYIYEALIPTTDINKTDKDRKYSESIFEALERPSVTNIALTGAYGSGKSSLIQSFIKEYSTSFSYLYISLANFPDFSSGDESNKIEESISQENADNKSDEEETKPRNEDGKKLNQAQRKELNQKIEFSILQQIFYQVKPYRIPDSRFKRIKKFRWKRSGIYSIFISLWLIIAYLTFNPSWLTKFFTSNDLTLLRNNQENFTLLLFGLFGFGLIVVIHNIIKYLNNSKIEKLNLKDGEIAISAENSILNRHLDEIIYFFEKTNYDVVIIEDLDRFEDTAIFSKLREINILLNQSEQIARKISFLYAIRDDMFRDEDRVKFFDSIIPIIPVVNVSNSKDILDRLVGENTLDSEFISNVTFFINDMRLLKNIVNEYKIYKEKIKPPNNEQLFSIILYKNIAPSDFVALHKGEGRLYGIISDDYRRKVASNLTSNIKDEVKLIENRIKEIEENSIFRKKDIRRIYLLELIKHIDNNFVHFLVDGEPKSLVDLLNIEENSFNRFIKTTIFYQYKGYYNNLENGSINISISQEYLERVNITNDNSSEKLKECQNKIIELKSQIRVFESYPLHMLLKEIDNKIIYDTPDKNINNLVSYLVRENYINRNYYDYISYFYEGSLSSDDRVFLSALRYDDSYNINRPLNKIENVLKEITNYQLRHSKVVLNYSLIAYLLENISRFENELILILDRKYTTDNTSISFVNDYLQNGQNIGLFLNYLIPKWKKVSSILFEGEDADRNLGYILESVSVDNIILLGDELKGYIATKKDFLLFVDGFDRKKIKEAITELDIEFVNLEFSQKDNDNELLKFIYKNSYYQVNKFMIDSMLKTYTNDRSILDLEQAHYTSICESSCEVLKEYVEKNIQKYSKVLANIEQSNQEKEESLVSLFNNGQIELVVKKQIAIRQKNKISTNLPIGSVEMRAFLISNSLIQPTWENVLRFFIETSTIDKNLVSFLNNDENAKKLGATSIKNDSIKSLEDEDEDFKESVNNFIRALTICSELSENVYEIYLNAIPIVYSSLAFSGVHQWQAKKLVESGTLKVTADNYNTLKHNFIECLHVELLNKDVQASTKLIVDGEIILNLEEYEQILCSRTFSFNNKIDIVLKTEIIPHINSSSSLSDIVVDLLLERNDSAVPVELLIGVFSHNANKSTLIKLLLNQEKYLTEKQLAILLNTIGEPYSFMTISRKRGYTINNTDYNSEFVERLKLRERFISTSEVSNDKIKINNKIIE